MSIAKGAGSRKQEAGSREQGAGSREQGAGNKNYHNSLRILILNTNLSRWV